MLGGTLCGGKESLFGTALIANDNGRLLHVLGGTWEGLCVVETNGRSPCLARR